MRLHTTECKVHDEKKKNERICVAVQHFCCSAPIIIIIIIDHIIACTGHAHIHAYVPYIRSVRLCLSAFRLHFANVYADVGVCNFRVIFLPRARAPREDTVVNLFHVEICVSAFFIPGS